MKPVQFHPEAEAEMIEAAGYYEAQQQDLGRRFLASV
jgi:toxin ParE1/3/4